MYKMLIVDDEYYSREGTIRMLDWEQYDIEIVGSAENGIEGIEMVKKLKPDIVLTDIRMKAMDGLSMIEELKKINIDCKFIIMSGYKVFEYAKRALEEGVDFYLLKPVSKELLVDALVNIKENIVKSKQDILLKQLEQSEHIMRDFINQSGRTIGEIDKCLGEEIKKYIICAVKLERVLSHYSQDKVKIYDILLQAGKNILILFVSDREFLLMLYNQGIDDTMIRKMKAALESKLNMCVNIGQGKVHTSIEDFITAKKQAYLALQFQFYDNEKRTIISYDDIHSFSNKIDKELIKLHERILHAIEVCASQSVHEVIYEAFERMESIKFIPQDICDWFKNLYMNIIYRMKQLGFFEDEIIGTAYGDLYSIDANDGFVLIDVIKKTEEFCLHCIELIEQSRKGNYANSIKEVVTYIDNHFAEEISLEYLEKIFYMEFSYLSKLFKKETGKSYLQYLTEKRMQKAKELMKNSSLTIYEIAARVSYTDAKYFSQLFKKIEGMSPSEYRATLLKNS